MKMKKMMLISTVGILGAVVFGLLFMERSTCMNIPLILEKELEQYTEVASMDLSQLTFEGEEIAVDWVGERIFISQPISAVKKKQLLGTVGTLNPEYSLAILKTDAVRDIEKAVREGMPLTLIIKCGFEYQRAELVITSLPLIALDLQETAEDAEGNVILNGTFVMWNSAEPEQEQYQTVKSEAQWHIRGNSSKIYPKQSWKLNLRENGKNKNLDLLSLGSDDDWILNSMNRDDTKVKERLAQELWNELSAETKEHYPMSRGEYVELVINGAYQGVYLLQRRVDRKYLNLDKNRDILLKGMNTWDAETIEDAYEIVSTPFTEAETYQIFADTISLQENQINLDNFMDTNLFVQLLSGYDNVGYKNMFYVLKDQGSEYELYWIPWDTDLSLGVTWGYDYEGSMVQITERQELEQFCEDIPELEEKLSKRWNRLRGTVYSEKMIFCAYERLTDILDRSGALQRDRQRWGIFYEGEDNRENLERFIKERLQMLDQYYASGLK